MSELLPCPFCGGQAECHQWWSATISGEYATVCTKCNCGTDYYNTEAEAIAAWNTRTEYHGYEQAAIEAWENIKKWNTRAERTCKNLSHEFAVFHCSECGYFERDCACT